VRAGCVRAEVVVERANRVFKVYPAIYATHAQSAAGMDALLQPVVRWVLSPTNVFFLVVLADAFVNAPALVPASRNANALVFAVAAVVVIALGAPGFVVVQAAFAIALAVQSPHEPAAAADGAATISEKQPDETKAQASANALPAPVEAFLAQCLSSFEASLNPQTNADGKPWILVNEANGIKIWQSDIPKLSCKRWKVETEIVGTRDAIFAELNDYANRPKWDSTLASGGVLKSYTTGLDGHAEVSLYYTAPAAGGAVSSREFADLGLIIKHANGGISYINASLQPELRRHIPSIPKAVKGVRGFTQPGSGMRITPLACEAGKEPTRFKYTLVNAIELGGWLPSSLINSATTQALTDGTRTMCEHLQRRASSKA